MLDKILVNLRDGLNTEIDKDLAEAKTAIKLELEKIVGEDEDYPTGDDIVEFDIDMAQTLPALLARNELRAEIRDRIKEL